MRLDENLVGIHSRFDEFLARALRRRDEKINLGVERIPPVMKRQRCRQRRRSAIPFAIAAMLDGRQLELAMRALFAIVPIAEEKRAGTENAIIVQRLHDRRALQQRLEQHDRLNKDATAAEMDKLYRRAYQFLDSPAAADAFHLEREPAKLRERYGLNVFGQSLLLARRLVEAGVPMITVYWPDRKEPEAFLNNGVRDSVAVPAWDTHGTKVGNTPNFPALRERLLPPLADGTMIGATALGGEVTYADGATTGRAGVVTKHRDQDPAIVGLPVDVEPAGERRRRPRRRSSPGRRPDCGR